MEIVSLGEDRPLCEERERLWQAYKDALMRFSKNVEELAQAGPAFPAAAEVCQRANEDCISARRAWEQHLKQHACDPKRRAAGAGSD
jgi:hypothetical protein